MIRGILAIWFLVFLPFLNPACTSGNSQFMYCWSLAWRILSMTLLACEMSVIVHSLNILWHCNLWDWNENWHFPILWSLCFPHLLYFSKFVARFSGKYKMGYAFSCSQGLQRVSFHFLEDSVSIFIFVFLKNNWN